jgi:uncharacterized peroxidase-related enzyme
VSTIASGTASDTVDDLAGSSSAALRATRPIVLENLDAADRALFAPSHGDFAFPVAERLIVALYTAALHEDMPALRRYAERASALGVAREIEDETIALAERQLAHGPYGRYPEGGPLEAESVDGLDAVVPRESVFGLKLASGLEHAHRVLLHPRDTTAAHVEGLLDSGWTPDQIVILTQVVSVLALQLRVASGLRAIAGAPAEDEPARLDRRDPSPARVEDDPVSGRTPERFTEHVVAWQPWLDAPIVEDGFDWSGTFGNRRASSPSFRLSARDPRISLPLSRIEDDVFGGSEGGLSRGERELGALVVSRLNGCLYCASVHSRSAMKFSGQDAAVRSILRDGVEVDLDPRWNALSDAAVALTSTPIAFGPADAECLRRVGLDDAEILDLVHSVGYFNFANRIMLTLGRPVHR